MHDCFASNLAASLKILFLKLNTKTNVCMMFSVTVIHLIY